MNEDDMFLDDPMVQALLAPGTDGELAGEAAVLDAFRASRRSGNHRRHLRLVTGAGGVVIALALTGGVAAAYTGNLPRTLQSAAHSLLGPISVPAPAPRARPVRADRATDLTARTTTNGSAPGSHASPGTTASPSAQVSPAAVVQPGAQPSPSATTFVVASPAAQPSVTPSATPAPAPVFTATASVTTVRVHTGLTLTGTLTRGDKPLADRTLYAVETVAGVQGSKRVASGKTAADGTVALAVPALTRNATLKLVTAAGVPSNTVRVTVLPHVTTKVTRSGGSYAVTATADGGQQGDTVVLQRWDNGAWVNVTSKKLTADKTAAFTVPVPRTDRRYRVRINATSIHGQALGPFIAKSA